MLKILVSRHVYIIHIAIRMHWNDKYTPRKSIFDLFFVVVVVAVVCAQIFHACLFPFLSLFSPFHSCDSAIVLPPIWLWWNRWKNFALIIIWIRNMRFPFYFIIRWNFNLFLFFTPVCTERTTERNDRAGTHSVSHTNQIHRGVQWLFASFNIFP